MIYHGDYLHNTRPAIVFKLRKPARPKLEIQANSMTDENDIPVRTLPPGTKAAAGVWERTAGGTAPGSTGITVPGVCECPRPLGSSDCPALSSLVYPLSHTAISQGLRRWDGPGRCVPSHERMLWPVERFRWGSSPVRVLTRRKMSGSGEFRWTVVVLTCQHKDSVYSFQRGERLSLAGVRWEACYVQIDIHVWTTLTFSMMFPTRF